MGDNIQELNRIFRDQHDITVNVIRYERDTQRVVYRRPGYEWECACSLIIFRARFTEVVV
ncbi:DUF4222 domain-containing protein [Serratia sp. JSRIV004]|uniref:DUF4222 domain-containing protein n=1 Tax=Serratia sp. JSRIV004 TaxID=2831895 RepID=UPI001CBC9670|nr:DUF4222 domain-containing protein [Serratia sp. JSRIV004]UAN58321.1 DUF4222 domain-containing protein [Serratia sp. JSRIV004]